MLPPALERLIKASRVLSDPAPAATASPDPDSTIATTATPASAPVTPAAMPATRIYTTSGCPYCAAVKQWFTAHRLPFTAIDGDTEPGESAALALSPEGSFPVVALPDGRVILGFDEPALAAAFGFRVAPLLPSNGGGLRADFFGRGRAQAPALNFRVRLSETPEAQAAIAADFRGRVAFRRLSFGAQGAVVISGPSAEAVVAQVSSDTGLPGFVFVADPV